MLVVDTERRVLDGERPGEVDALVDVAQQSGAVTQTREVVECVPHALTHLLYHRTIHRSSAVPFVGLIYKTRQGKKLQISEQTLKMSDREDCVLKILISHYFFQMGAPTFSF